MNYKKLNNIIGWVVFAIASYVYLATMEETTSLWDCGEYITTANKLEVGHPPGAPLFMIIGRLFSAFASPENAAMMVNSMSALSSSFTILFLFWSLTMLAKKLATKNGKEEFTKDSMIAVLGTGIVGALTYTFTDSFWFSAVEGEVYAMSSFFTAIVFWAILKWEVEVDKYTEAARKKEVYRGHPDRWLVFIAYMIGLSIGVHLLNLLAIPAIAFVVYFKKYKFTQKTFIFAGIVALFTLGVVQAVIIPKTVDIADWFERTFTNSIGLPFNIGAFIFILFLAGIIIWGIKKTTQEGREVLNTVILSFAVLLIGYSSFTMIVVRSNANTPLDENNPETLGSLVSYLNRDQYGTWPLLYGQYWNTPTYGDCSEEHLQSPKVAYMKAFSIKSKQFMAKLPKAKAMRAQQLLSGFGLKESITSNKKTPSIVNFTVPAKEISFMNMFELEEYRTSVKSLNEVLKSEGIEMTIAFEDEITKKYINTYAHKPKGDKKYVAEFCTTFPRMYRQGEGPKYMIWSDYVGDPNHPLPGSQQVPIDGNRPQQYQALVQAGYTDVAQQIASDGMYKPTMGENLRYMVKYQIGWMYWRYFLWNFVGRQNDTQGYGYTGGGSKILEGNWLSGVDFVDEERLGSQQNLPSLQTDNAGYNKYYFIPLILGLIGFIFHVVKSPKDWFIILLLFLLTGLAIVIYLNQKPAEPRERDYAYAASFYAFAFWVGLGVYALFDAAKNMSWKQLAVISGYTFGSGVLIYLVESGSKADHSFSYSILYMGVIAVALHAVFVGLGGAIKNGMSSGMLATGFGLVAPFLLAQQNWDDHDRSNRTTARDFAYNYLASCDKNAILFTNGDNDTFPLWYIQEVEGVRTDVRVANMSLLSTDWHINQMKRQAYESDPLPITMNEYSYRNGTRDYILIDQVESKKGKFYPAEEAMEFILDDNHQKVFPGMCNPEFYIDFTGVYITVDKKAALENGIVTPEQADQMVDTIRWNIKGGAIYKADLAVLDILAHYKWDRPIYFASLGGIGANSRLTKYMQAEGMAYKFVPIDFGSGGGANTDKMYQLFTEGYELELPDGKTDKVTFEWGNMKGNGVLVDYYTMRMVQNSRLQIMRLTDALIAEGKKDKAVEVLDKTFEVMPIDNNQVPAGGICYYLCANYYDAGANEKGDALAKKLVQLELENLNYYLSLDDQFFEQVWSEFGKAMNNLEMLREASLKDAGMNQMFEPDPTNLGFKELGVLEGTSFMSTLASVKQKFNRYVMSKQQFFTNGQKFPVVYTQLWAQQ